MTRPYPQVHPHVLVRGDAAAGGGGGGSGLGFPFKGALVIPSVDQSVPNVSGTVVDFATAFYNVGGFWDSGTPNRFTVPAGVTKIKLMANIAWLTAFTSDRMFCRFQKNGGDTGVIMSGPDSTVSGSAIISWTSPVLEVVEGDYFDIIAYHSFGSAATIDAINVFHQTHFAIEAVDGIAPSTTPRGAVATLSADITGQNVTTITAIPLDTEVRDTDNIHDVVTNNTRMTVPIGVTHVRLSGQVGIGAITSGTFGQAQIYKNGVIFDPAIVSKQEVSDVSQYIQIGTPILEVSPGDYFELMVRVESDTSVTLLDVGTYFELEIINPAIVSGRPLLLHARHEEAQNVHAGTFTSGAWRVRVLNVVPTNEISGASVASNQITLAAGTYEIDAYTPAYKVVSHKARLYDTTGAAVLIVGTSETSNTGTDGESQTRSLVRGRFTLTTQSVLELQHRCATTFATLGLGRGVNLDGVEVYSEVLITKIS